MGVITSPSKSDNWGTPIDKFIEWDHEFRFTLDPCANRKRILAPHFWFHEYIWNGKRSRPGISFRFLKRLHFYDIDRDKSGSSSKLATFLVIFRNFKFNSPGYLGINKQR